MLLRPDKNDYNLSLHGSENLWGNKFDTCRLLTLNSRKAESS